MPTKEPEHAGGKYLRALRKAKGLTQGQLGQAVGFTRDNEIRYFEQGNPKRWPSVDELRKICDALTLTPAQLHELLKLYGFKLVPEVTTTKSTQRSDTADEAKALESDEASLVFIIKGVDERDEKEEALLAKSFDCYEQLFLESQRDPRRVIEKWIEESYEAEHTDPMFCDDLWRERWGVLHIGDDVIGISYFSVHLDYPWAFGNYFGVLKGDQKQSSQFLARVVKHLQQTIVPDLKGLVFEIDKIELEYLEAMASDKENIILPDERLFANLRSLRKLKSFQHSSSYPFLGHNKRPLPYWQPSLDKKMREIDEVELILMVKPLAGVEVDDIKPQDVLDFVYDKLYIDAYDAKMGSVRIPKYRHHVTNIKRRVEEEMRIGCSIEQLNVPPEIDDLIDLVVEQGYKEQIKLR